MAAEPQEAESRASGGGVTRPFAPQRVVTNGVIRSQWRKTGRQAVPRLHTRGRRMEKIWLKHYPAGVPAEIDASQYASLVALLEESFAKYKDRNAYICMDKKLTYRPARRHVARLRRLAAGHGPEARRPRRHHDAERAAVSGCVAGILRAGMTVVNVNPLYTPRELEHQLKDSGAKAIIILENFATTLEKVLEEHAREARHPRQHGRPARLPEGRDRQPGGAQGEEDGAGLLAAGRVQFKAALAAGQGQAAQHARRSRRTTSRSCSTPAAPPACRRARRCCTATSSPTCCRTMRGCSPRSRSKPKVDQLMIVTALPLYHIFALTACFLLGMRIGGMCLLIPNPRDIPGFVKELQKYKVHMFPAVNTLYNALLNHPDFGKLDFSQLKAANGGGMAVQRAVAERWFKATGVPIIEGYGLSETSPTLTCNRADNNEYTGTIGLPVPSTEISIRDDDGNEVPLGEPGEICARGPQVMAGYWQRPEETAQVMTKDGFFRTGDIGVMDEQGARSRSSTARRTWCWSRASTSIPTRSRTWWRCIRACSSAPWSACPTRHRARP